jgi:membrane protein YqaA with SNARE-associated domain
MFDWLQVLARRLGYFIVHVPIYVAGPAMILIGALDSSLLSLPEVNDYLVVARCYAHPRTVFFFPLFAAIGSVLGCLLLYTILSRGGRAVLHRRFKLEHVLKVERAYARFGILALAVPALLPPPMPFKIFVATAGALQFPRRRFLVTILLARSLRYYVEGTLAVFYGERVLRFLKDNGLLIVSIVAGVCLVALAIYLLTRKGRAAAESGKIDNSKV